MIHLPRAACACAWLVLLVGGCCQSTPDDAMPQAEAATSVLVQTIPAKRRNLTETLTLYGEITQDVGASENVSFARPVLISRLLVTAGEHVRAGQPLLEVATDPAAASAYKQAQSAMELARRELASQQELANERLATNAQLAAARKALADAESELAAQRQIGAAPGAQTVRATHDAVVASLSAQQGDRVQPGTAVLQLSRSGAQRALLGAEPEDVNRLSPGMPVRLTPVFGGDAVPASISQVFGVINPQTRLVDVAVRIDGERAQMLAGVKVRGEVTLTAPEVWVVPRSAVLADDHGSYIFQVAGGHAKRVRVTIQVENGESQGIAGAIDPKLPIVTSGNYELDDGMAVRAPGK